MKKKPYIKQYVSIRALARRATRGIVKGDRGPPCFNSCPRAEGNLLYFSEIIFQRSFNSCPRAEGNLSVQCTVFQNSVSIRALARRATVPILTLI